ncbi:MAG: zf-HC2 domain-containing protein [bacterium]|nr:zf-HC2 domain-containing protein [bacterium]
MDCRQIIELLPWYLNGSLSPEEDRRVRGHLKDCAGCRAELGETLFAAKVFSAHPETAALVDLVFDPSGADRTALEHHLLLCPDCAEQVALLRRSASLRGGRVRLPAPAPVAARRVSRVWRPIAIAASLLLVVSLGGWCYSWQRSVAAEQELVAEKQSAAAEQERAERAAAAEQERAEKTAAAEVRETGTSAEISRLRQVEAELTRRLDEMTAEIAERGAPRFSAVIFDLMPSSFLQRSQGSPVKPVQVPPDAGWVTLFLTPQADISSSENELELLDADGEVLWSCSGRLVQEPEGDFAVSLPSSLLKAGEMTIRIYSGDGSARREVESFPFEVVAWTSEQ